MFLSGSDTYRPGGPPRSDGVRRSYADGSPVDRSFFSLILWGAVVLARREIHWGRLLRPEQVDRDLTCWYCLASVLWSDAPVILMKRWIKDPAIQSWCSCS